VPDVAAPACGGGFFTGKQRFFNPAGSGNSIFHPVNRRFFQECSIAARGEKGAAGQTIQQEIRRIDDESMTDR
jgi:hypothetical protein